MVATITGGTILWFVLFVVQLPFYGWFDDRGQAWWVWTCLAGGGLGLIGIWYVRRRDAALKRATAPEEPGKPRANPGRPEVPRRTTTARRRSYPGRNFRALGG
ncbi:DUF2530 domain-containing protein [Streptomyces sp. MS1.AVA.1]|uniref:DUF2530 domain-containing protein n=1 Tax=Streptomyces machairae TaxID=3134109 RepID=A0ABU8ULV2_9ACTN